MVQIVIPVGPRDNLEWVKRSVQSALEQGVEVIVYDNSERRDIHEYFLALQGKLRYVRDGRMSRVNMAKLRNRMLSLVTDKYAVMLDSDVVMPRDAVSKMVRKLEGGVHFTWMHYAYSEEEMNQPLSAMEENPNLGCAGLNVETVRKLGGFDEKYERDEDVWLYAKLKKEGYRVEPSEGRCLHLNRVHSRPDLRSSLLEARRNLWRSKYDMMLVMDGLTDLTFLTGYTYYGSYYVLALLSAMYHPLALLYVPLVGFGVYYYKGIRKYFLNLIPGLALALSLPYGLAWNLTLKMKRSQA